VKDIDFAAARRALIALSSSTARGSITILNSGALAALALGVVFFGAAGALAVVA